MELVAFAAVDGHSHSKYVCMSVCMCNVCVCVRVYIYIHIYVCVCSIPSLSSSRRGGGLLVKRVLMTSSLEATQEAEFILKYLER